ncbi:Rhodanese-like domain [Macleaya cordata]|uniref:Rhodanese-like domain n=1 Tax=Macleaya cordata TaxID=56857 RepID=A0A200QSX4_MACCD|nr:Rhodanese-like domain [Macleaya cordata]
MEENKQQQQQEEEEDGILLYYKYAHVPDINDLVSFYDSNCKSLGLLGRVRIAPDGVNVTVGGKLSSLEIHIAAVKLNNLFEGTDFKLASCSCPLNDKIAKECGFTSLSIRVVKELVTFSSHPLLKSPTISNAGRHLSAAQFHSVLHSAGSFSENEGHSQRKQLFLLDARNLYETRIGKFQTSNVETLDPEIRQYSDLPSWIDSHAEQLQGNSVLMYCTGGIRCEMASAYIRSKGAGFENVFQLYGGIQRYLEQFPDGGFFKGKNFVFDHRISVGSSNADVVGSCLLCGSSFDDYSSRCRCTYCRMLVLVCDRCQKDGAKYVCELCQKQSKGIEPVPLIGSSGYLNSTPDDGSGAVELESATLCDHMTSPPEHPQGHGSRPPKKLKILCLHGFRQNASGFKGRTASLTKKLKDIAELVFIDAPHELPFIYQPRPTEIVHGSIELEVQKGPPPLESCKKKFAWLVAQDFNSSRGTNWKIAEERFDPLQYRQQTDGYDTSLAYLKDVFSQSGPFDGILGFSQGAAMAASVCGQRGRLDGEIDFKFAILCSGFALQTGEFEMGSIKCPSIHVFGNGLGKDRQIARNASMELANLFEKSCSLIIEHESGHIIPTRSPYIDQIKAFLLRFL